MPHSTAHEKLTSVLDFSVDQCIVVNAVGGAYQLQISLRVSYDETSDCSDGVARFTVAKDSVNGKVMVRTLSVKPSSDHRLDPGTIFLFD